MCIWTTIRHACRLSVVCALGLDWLSQTAPQDAKYRRCLLRIFLCCVCCVFLSCVQQFSVFDSMVYFWFMLLTLHHHRMPNSRPSRLTWEVYISMKRVGVFLFNSTVCVLLQAVPIISQTRFLEKRGEFQDVAKGGTIFNLRPKFSPVFLYLFNDLLVIASRKRWEHQWCNVVKNAGRKGESWVLYYAGTCVLYALMVASGQKHVWWYTVYE